MDAVITGYEKPLYILPFDHRHSYITGVFHWHDPLTPGQVADIVASKQIDLAVLDMKVRDGTTTAVADALADRGIPFIFSSGSDVGAFPKRHIDRPMVSKPFLDDDLKLVILDTWMLRSSGRAGDRGERVATSGASD